MSEEEDRGREAKEKEEGDPWSFLILSPRVLFVSDQVMFTLL